MTIVRKQGCKPKLKCSQAQYRDQPQYHDQAYETRIKKAILSLRKNTGAFSLTKASKLYDVSKTTLFNPLSKPSTVLYL